MSWISALRASGGTKATDPSDETVFGGGPYDASRGSRRGAEQSAAGVAYADGQLTAEIRQRQRLLLARYVVTLRAHYNKFR